MRLGDSMPGLLSSFPDTDWNSDARLLVWRPKGVLDDDLADRIVEFVELEELICDAPFHRYTDFTGLTHIRLRFGHVFRMSERRRESCTGKELVRSAFFCD